jgi:hypothetical protein
MLVVERKAMTGLNTVTSRRDCRRDPIEERNTFCLDPVDHKIGKIVHNLVHFVGLYVTLLLEHMGT